MKFYYYFIILFIFAALFSIFFTFYPNDLYPSTMAAHTGYISQFNQKLGERYEVNLLKGGSFYYIFYFAIYPFLGNSLHVIALYYYTYFILWGITVIYGLKNFGKLNLENFLIAMSLSINESLIYGVASFMMSLVYLIFSYVFMNKIKDKTTYFIVFVVISSFILHFLHPYSSIMFIMLSFLIISERLNKKEKLLYITVIFISFLAIEAGASIFFSYSKSKVTKYYLDFLTNDPTKFIYHTFIERKIAHFFFQILRGFNLYIPLIAYFISFCEFNQKIKKIGMAIIIFMLIVPESFPTTQSFGWRFIPLLLLFMLFGSNQKNTKFLKYLIIIILLHPLMTFYNIFLNPETETITPLNYEKYAFIFDASYNILNLVKNMGYRDIAFFGNYNFHFPYLIEMMDKENFTYSYSYTFSSHPVSPKKGISANDEIKFIELFKNKFEEPEKLDKKEADYYAKELCKNYDIFLNFGTVDKIDINNRLIDIRQPLKLYVCRNI